MAFLLALLCSLSFAQAQPARSPFYEQAVAESLVPIRPGVPGRAPFWNGHARRFIYAPAFDFPQVKGAGAYRFEVETAHGNFTFEADVPWAPLTPVWKQVPAGIVKVAVVGLDRKGGKPAGASGQRTFYRSAVFNGPYGEPVTGYQDSARRALETIFHQPAMQRWLRDGKPEPSYPLNCYPAKVMGATVLGMTLYSKLAADAGERKQALEIARRAADFLVGLSQPANAPLAWFPPTYWDGVKPGTHPVHMDRLMMHYASDAAFGYLDLYDATGDKKYFEAARHIAATYRARQLPGGTWPLVAEIATGRGIGPNLLVPTWPISLMERLATQYGVTEYLPVAARAFRWIEENPMRRFNWDAQFEDAKPREPYVNMSREQACDAAVYLLDHRAKDPAAVKQAEELLRFAEDQFVVWENPGPDWKTIFRRDTSAWITPGVLEQYTFYVPIIRSIGIMIGAWHKAYQVTGKPIYEAKAHSLANAITIAQKHWNGEYPTLLAKTESNIWLNNTVYAAKAMYELGKTRRGDTGAR